MYARHAGTYTERHQFDGWCKPMGFDDNDGLWKKADTAFSGYQLLLEYFSFRPKFMFVELRGLDTIGLTEASSWFEIDIVLSEAWSSDCLLRQKTSGCTVRRLSISLPWKPIR
jgi:type VI secretion system protein ImpG